MSTAREVAGRYRVIRPIGRGSAGVVYIAEDTESGRELRALKLIPARPGLRPDEAQRFRQEARNVVQHAGVLHVLEAGLDGDGKTLYVVMELLHGSTLRQLLPELSLEQRMDLLERALDPLTAAHQRGFVHGDLRMENLFQARMRDGREEVRLLDLGLGGVLARGHFAAAELTHHDPRFTAPEALDASAHPTPSADVWSFGVMLYEAASGRLPFDGESPEAIARAVRHAPHRPLDEVVPGVAVNTARLADLCLDKTPARRPADARTLLRLLKTLRSTVGLSQDAARGYATVLDHSGAAPPPPPEELDAELARSPRDPHVHRRLLGFYTSEGIRDGAWLAASALDFLKSATKEEIHLHHHHRRFTDIEYDRGLDERGWAALLHPDQDPRIDAVWGELVGPLSELHRRSDDDLGLTSAQKVDVGRPSDELAKAFRAALGTIRPGVIPRLYRGKAGKPPRHLPASPPASVFPVGFEEPLPSGALAFAVARHVAYYRQAHRACTLLREPDALESIFLAGIRLGLGMAPETEDQSRMVELLRPLLTPQTQEKLRFACARLGARAADLGTWRRAVELSACRAGLAVGGDLEGAAWMLRWARERRRIPIEDAIDDLLRFWSSGAHVRVRHLLGIAISA